MKLLIALIKFMVGITVLCFRSLERNIVQAVRDEDWICVAIYAIIPALILFSLH